VTMPMTRMQRLEAVCPVFLEMARQAIRAEREKADKAAIARARAVGAGHGIKEGNDFGPPIRGDQIEREFRPDPDPRVGPLLHGGRVRDGLHAMYKRRFITMLQYHSVCRLRDDIDLAGGARIDPIDNAGIRSTHVGARWPDEYQLDAIMRVRNVWAWMPSDSQPVAYWMVMGGTLADYARSTRCRPAEIGDRFKAALDGIVAFYEVHGS
jgi:hypothetical protein